MAVFFLVKRTRDYTRDPWFAKIITVKREPCKMMICNVLEMTSYIFGELDMTHPIPLYNLYLNLCRKQQKVTTRQQRHPLVFVLEVPFSFAIIFSWEKPNQSYPK